MEWGISGKIQEKEICCGLICNMGGSIILYSGKENSIVVFCFLIITSFFHLISGSCIHNHVKSKINKRVTVKRKLHFYS